MSHGIDGVVDAKAIRLPGHGGRIPGVVGMFPASVTWIQRGLTVENLRIVPVSNKLLSQP